MVIFLLILALIVAVAAVVFVLQNASVVPVVTLFIWQFENKPLALILLLALAAGIIIGVLTILPGSIRHRWRTSTQRKRINALEKNLKDVQLKLDQARLDMAALQAKPEPAVPNNAPTATQAPPAAGIAAPPPEATPPVEEPPAEG